MATKLVELREKRDAKDALVRQVLDQAGEDLDFSKVKCLGEGLDTQAKVEQFRGLNAELADLETDIRGRAALEAAAKARAANGDISRTPAGPSAPHPSDDGEARSPVSMKAIADRLIASEEYKAYREDGAKGFSMMFDDVDLKTLMSTTQGWAPDSDRTGRLVEAVTRPIQILDLIPVGDTDSNSVTYWEETLRTHGAAEKVEGAAYAESAFEWTEKTSQVRKITDSLPVTDEQLEDRSQLRTLLDQRLGFGVRQRLDLQVVDGDGVPPNLEGITNVAGIQTQAKGADPRFDAVHKGITKVRVTGRAMPGAIVMHSNDWQEIRLTRTADGIYILGNPAIAGPMQLFGLPVALNEAIDENTALVGDFQNYCRIYDRRGLSIQVGYVGDQFKEGKQTLRADIRVAFVVERPAAFCTVTGL
jgi:HK97 family phage major capsid protein